MKNTDIRNLENEYKIYTSVWGIDGYKYGICVRSFIFPTDEDNFYTVFCLNVTSTFSFEI